eukprot:tig00021221_g19346.t1
MRWPRRRARPRATALRPRPLQRRPRRPRRLHSRGEILWRVNYDQAVVRLVSEKYNPTAATIVRSVLLVTAPFEKTRCDPTTCVFYVDQVHPSLPIDLNVNKNKLGDYMELLCKDTTGIATKHGETGGGAYTLNLRAALEVPRGQDHNPQRTFYLWAVNLPRLLARLVDQGRKAASASAAAAAADLASPPTPAQLYRACFNVRRRLLAEVARRDQLLRGSGNGGNGNGAAAAAGGAAKAGAGDKEKAGAAGADGERTVAEMQQQARPAFHAPPRPAPPRPASDRSPVCRR